MFKWIRERKKPNGIPEKMAATRKKLEVAIKILNRRKEQVFVELERRERDEWSELPEAQS